MVAARLAYDDDRHFGGSCRRHIIGFWQGFWVAYGDVPAFIVTLGGLLIFRGTILGITKGVNIRPMDPSFRGLGQSYLGFAGGMILAVLAVAGVFAFALLLVETRSSTILP